LNCNNWPEIEFIEDGHLYYVNGNNIKCVSNIVHANGLSDFSMIDPVHLQWTMARGKAIHLACELYDNGNLDESTIDDEVMPYFEGWVKYIEKEKPVFTGIERRVYSKLWQYCGTVDRITDNTIKDIKTVNTVSGLSCKAQTALYQIAYEEETGIKIKQREVIHLVPGDYKIITYKDKSDITAVKSMVSVMNWKANNK